MFGWIGIYSRHASRQSRQSCGFAVRPLRRPTPRPPPHHHARLRLPPSLLREPDRGVRTERDMRKKHLPSTCERAKRDGKDGKKQLNSRLHSLPSPHGCLSPRPPYLRLPAAVRAPRPVDARRLRALREVQHRVQLASIVYRPVLRLYQTQATVLGSRTRYHARQDRWLLLLGGRAKGGKARARGRGAGCRKSVTQPLEHGVVD